MRNATIQATHQELPLEVWRKRTTAAMILSREAVTEAAFHHTKNINIQRQATSVHRKRSPPTSHSGQLGSHQRRDGYRPNDYQPHIGGYKPMHPGTPNRPPPGSGGIGAAAA